MQAFADRGQRGRVDFGPYTVDLPVDRFLEVEREWSWSQLVSGTRCPCFSSFNLLKPTMGTTWLVW